MARHEVKGRGYVVVYRPVALRRSRLAWWGIQGLRVALPLGVLALLPWAPVPALLLAWGFGLASITVGSSVHPPGVEVTGWRNLAEWRSVDDACQLVARSWPTLGDLAEPLDIRPTLARARYEVATLFAARHALDETIDDLRTAPYALNADDPLSAEAGARRDDLLARRRVLTEQIETRITALRRLAQRTGEFAYQRAGADRVRRALRRAGAAEATARHLPTSDAIREVEERTRAVLDAYRELLAEFTPAP